MFSLNVLTVAEEELPTDKPYSIHLAVSVNAALHIYKAPLYTNCIPVLQTAKNSCPIHLSGFISRSLQMLQSQLLSLTYTTRNKDGNQPFGSQAGFQLF